MLTVRSQIIPIIGFEIFAILRDIHKRKYQMRAEEWIDMFGPEFAYTWPSISGATIIAKYFLSP